MVAVQHAVQLVFEPGLVLNQLAAMSDEGTQLAHVLGRYPDLGHQASP